MYATIGGQALAAARRVFSLESYADRCLLANEHAVFREGLRALLEREGMHVVGEAAHGQEAVRLAGQLHPASR